MDVDAEEAQLKLRDQLTKWWYKQAEDEIEAVIPKAVEYGASDLAVMGRAMEYLIPADKPVVDGRGGGEINRQRMGLEMAIAFYQLGKIARAFGAFERGEFPSDDTYHDMNVYGRMLQKVRETGRWI